VTPVIKFAMGLGISPHLFIRWYSANSPRTIKWVSAGGAAYLLFFYVPIVFISLGGVLNSPGISPDSVVPTMLFEFTPVWFAAIIISGAIAAAMSTKDSKLHAMSALLSRDWYQGVINEDASTKRTTRVSQFLVLILGVLGYLLAVQRIDLITLIIFLGLEAVVQLFPMVFAVFWWDGASSEGATVGLLAGITVVAIIDFGLWAPPSSLPSLNTGLYGLIVNVPLFVMVSYFTESVPREKVDKIQGYTTYAKNRKWESDTTGAPAPGDD